MYVCLLKFIISFNKMNYNFNMLYMCNLFSGLGMKNKEMMSSIS